MPSILTARHFTPYKPSGRITVTLVPRPEFIHFHEPLPVEALLLDELALRLVEWVGVQIPGEVILMGGHQSDIGIVTVNGDLLGGPVGFDKVLCSFEVFSWNLPGIHSGKE